jgi:Ca2+-binding EF-hand superfamily protein
MSRRGGREGSRSSKSGGGRKDPSRSRNSRGSSGGGSKRSSGSSGGGRSSRSGGGGRGGSRGGRSGRGGSRGGSRGGRSGGRSGRGGKSSRSGRGNGEKGDSKRKGKKSSKKKKTNNNGFKKLMGKVFPCCKPPVEVKMNTTAKSAAKALGFTEEDCAKLKRRFDDIDVDLTGEIGYDELLDDINEARSAFTDAVFAMVDVNGNGELDFDEYIQIFMTYCMFNKEEILTFTYECFDKDGSGTIDEEEFMLLAKTVNNSAPLFPGNFATALAEFDSNDDGLIDPDEFRELNRAYPMVLFPAFRFQDNLQRGSLGQNRWVQIQARKAKLAQLEEYRKNHKGQLPPVSSYIDIMSKILPCCYKHPYNDVLDALTGEDTEDETSGMTSP